MQQVTEAQYLALFQGLKYPEHVRKLIEAHVSPNAPTHAKHRMVVGLEKFTGVTPQILDERFAEEVAERGDPDVVLRALLINGI